MTGNQTFSYHQHLLVFPVLVIPVRRLSADAFQLLLDDCFQHGISRTWTSCGDTGEGGGGGDQDM